MHEFLEQYRSQLPAKKKTLLELRYFFHKLLPDGSCDPVRMNLDESKIFKKSLHFCVKFKFRTNEKTSLPHGLHTNQPTPPKKNTAIWWLNQPIWKICSSKWESIFPFWIGVKISTNLWAKPPPKTQVGGKGHVVISLEQTLQLQLPGLLLLLQNWWLSWRLSQHTVPPPLEIWPYIRAY